MSDNGHFARPRHALTNAQRAEVEKIAHDLVIQECAKVHEFYLEQIPTHAARMVQDALVHYQLIKPIEPVDSVPAVVDAASSEPAP